MSSFTGVFQIDMSSSFAVPVLPPSQPVSPLRTQAQQQQTYRPSFRVPYHGAPAHLSPPSPPSATPYTPALLPISDARTRRWVTAHALVSAESNLSTYSCRVEEEKSVFSDDSDLESVSASSHDDEDESCIVESISGSVSESDDDDESAIFMTRNHSHLRLRSTNPSTTSFSRPPSLPRGRPAARRGVTKGLRPITPPSAAPVILDYSRARGLSSSVSSKQATQAQQHPRSSPSSSSLVAPSLTTDDSDVSTAPSVSESIPIPSALSRGRCRPSRIPPSDDDSEDERWWRPSPPDAARKERERAIGGGAFWDGWMKTANYA